MGTYGANALVVNGTNTGFGTASPGRRADFIGRIRLRSDGSVGAGAWFTDNSGTENVFVGLEGSTATATWGVYSNTAWRFQVTNTSGDVYLNSKLAFTSSDGYLRINEGAAFTNGIWFGSSPFIGLGGTDSYVGLGSNGGTTTSRIYFRAGTYNGTNVLYLDGTTGNIYGAGSLGVGTAPSGTAGEIRATNEITAYYSDSRLKNFISPINNALEKVTALTGYYYTGNDVAASFGYDTEKVQVGVSAQEVQAVLPEIVVPAPIDEKYLTVKYEKLTPLLIEAIKQLQQKIEALEKKIHGNNIQS
jgi:hypothetical protein